MHTIAIYRDYNIKLGLTEKMLSISFGLFGCTFCLHALYNTIEHRRLALHLFSLYDGTKRVAFDWHMFHFVVAECTNSCRHVCFEVWHRLRANHKNVIRYAIRKESNKYCHTHITCIHQPLALLQFVLFYVVFAQGGLNR